MLIDTNFAYRHKCSQIRFVYATKRVQTSAHRYPSSLAGGHMHHSFPISLCVRTRWPWSNVRCTQARCAYLRYASVPSIACAQCSAPRAVLHRCHAHRLAMATHWDGHRSSPLVTAFIIEQVINWTFHSSPLLQQFCHSILYRTDFEHEPQSFIHINQ